MPLLTATVELGSSRSGNKPWTVHVKRDDRKPVIIAPLAPHAAIKLAEQLNELFDDRPELLRSCAVCDKPIEQPATGRPRFYCSAACSQAAYRDRQLTQHV